MTINLNKLRKKIKDSSFKMIDISVILGVSERNLYYKLNGSLTIEELNTICRILNIELEELLD
ncbi:MAG: helix-turn-helix domain-containing protein [Clostridia bacterium]|nr:helix-turn-helix domain-containing protein [Clostridia bacterium]